MNKNADWLVFLEEIDDDDSAAIAEAEQYAEMISDSIGILVEPDPITGVGTESPISVGDGIGEVFEESPVDF